ncbi:endonuclease [Fragilaria crotonensis]|nr:endonuclease [Fragilaria crotonensis]
MENSGIIKDDNGVPTIATHDQRMKDIFEHWLSYHPKPRTAEPFRILIQHYQTTCHESDALDVLRKWGTSLGGNLELAPPLEAFHWVLASTAPPSKTQELQYSEFARRSLIGYLERCHTMGNYSLTPTVETYSHGLNAYHVAKDPPPPGMVVKLQEAFDSALQWEWTPEAAYHMIRGYTLAISWLPYHDETLKWFDSFEANIKRTDAIKRAQKVKNPGEQVQSLIDRAYLSALRILSTTPSEELKSAEKAMSMLDFLVTLQFDDLPSVEHYRLVAKCWAKPALPRENVGRVVQELLKRFEDQHLAKASKSHPLSIDFYEIIIRCWTSRGRAGDAEALLKHLMMLRDNGHLLSSDHRVLELHNCVLQGYFRESRMEKVIQLFDRITVPKNAKTYGFVLKAISRLPNDGVAKAKSVWEALQAEPHVTPSNTHYGSLIATWSRSSSRKAAEYALEALDILEDRFKKERMHASLKPHPAHYTGVITAFSRGARDHRNIKTALQVFDRMKKLYQPDTISYSALISALASGRTVEFATRAEELLDEMEMLSELPEGYGINPNVVTYTTVMRAWAGSGSPHAPENVERIFEKLEERYRFTGDEAFRPDSVTFGTLLHPWSRSGRPDAAIQAERIVQKARKMELETGTQILNSIMYTSVMLAHWRSDDQDAVAKVLALLDTMNDRVAEGDVHCAPDRVTYSVVIQALARSNAPDKAVKAWDFLNEVLQEYKEGRLPHVRPNAQMFTAVLNACAYTRGNKFDQTKAVQIALEVMEEFKRHEYDEASSLMYSTLLEVFTRNVWDQEVRLLYARDAFQQCCNDGVLDKTMIEIIEKYVPGLYEELPKNVNNEVEVRPEWTMNAGHGNARNDVGPILH